jgi:D-arabinose 1-dehydrogenase-like Zn-dependent alcohol dehydrogenase
MPLSCSVCSTRFWIASRSCRFVIRVLNHSTHFSHWCCLDTGAEKQELCLKLGAEKWIDFRVTKDLVKDIQDAAGGDGPHAALVSAASVSR